MRSTPVISPIAMHPAIAGNRARIHRLLTGPNEMGHEVHFLCQLSGRLARAAYEFAEKWNQEALSELASILG
jgi:hypothetical protein